MILSMLLAVGILLMAGCSQRYNENVTTTQYESYYDDEDASEADWDDEEDWEVDETTTTTKTTTAKKTESVKKDWKQAYIDYIYDLEDSYNGLIVYYPCPDFTGDGIDDFICSLGNKEGSVTEKEIAVAYYNGGVSTLTSKTGFQGYDPYNYYVGESAGSNDDWSDEGSRINYYKFSNGKFVFVKTDGYGDLYDHASTYLYQTYEMINEIKKGNDHGFNF